MVRDRIGNSLKSAFKLGNFPSSIRRSDALGGNDYDDLYHFNLNSRSNLILEASKTGNGKVGVQLLALKDKVRTLRAIGQTNFNKLSAKNLRRYLNPLTTTTATNSKSTSLNINLEAGEYYFRFFQKKKQSVRYNFNFSAFPTPASSLPLGGASPSSPSTGGQPGPSQPGSPSTPANPTPSTTQQWVRQFGTSGADNSYSTTTDGAGNVYAAGEMSGNGFVSKYNSSGQQLWQRTLPLNGSDTVYGVSVDGVGNYYVAGAYNLSATASDGFIAKYDNNGNQLWLTSIVTTAAGAPALDAATGITIDSKGNVFAAGFLQASVFAGYQGDAFVAKLNGNTGQLMTEFGGDGIATYNGSRNQADAASKVAVDSSGNVYITGVSDATLATRTPSNLFQGGNTFVASFNSNGSLRWQNTLDNNTGQQDYGRDITVSGDAIYIAGQTTTALPGSTFAGGGDGFVAKYSTSGGSPRWLKHFGTSGAEEAQSITVDGSGRIYVAGRTNQSLFGSYYGGYDAIVAVYDSNGSLIKGMQLGTLRNDAVYGVAASGSVIYLTGQTEGTFVGSTSQGSADVWVARYNLN